MTQYKLSAPKKLDATVALPASKSISNRALIIYALSGGHIMPQNLSDCDDTEVIINAIRYMPDVIDIKAAGTAMRFMTAYLSLMRGTHTLTGTERMKKRPIKILVDALRSLGAEISYLEEEGFPPLSITGTKLTGSVLEMSGSVSSQYISAVLMIGPMLDKGFELRLTGDIISRPYIDLTLYMMNEFGADADWTSADTITIKPVPYKTREYLIENDWSGASYWYEMMALMDNPDAKLMLTGLKDGSKQGDSVARYIFSMLGVKTVFESKTSRKPQTVTITANGRSLPRLEYDFINSPDLAQTFVVTCAAKGVRFHFKGLSTLKIKETDRIEALKKEMRKLGYVIESRNDSELIWDGETCEPQMEKGIDTYEDHRMALAFAPYALKSGEIIINNPQVVTKSYPHFWESLEEVGFKIEVIEQ